MTAILPEPKVVLFSNISPVSSGDVEIHYVRARSFIVAYTETVKPTSLTIDAEEETILLLPDVGADIVWEGRTIVAPKRSVVILPVGEVALTIRGTGRVIYLQASVPKKLDLLVINADPKGPPLQGIDNAFRRVGIAGPVVHVIDELPHSPGMARAKLFQSSTMSINWVEYRGARNRAELSPHFHDDIEQGSLALTGEFVHHFRTPWGRNADFWCEDLHVRCGAGSIALIPPGIIHTTEGVGDEHHLLIDIFTPPRRDFIKKGQILNSDDYEDPLEVLP